MYTVKIEEGLNSQFRRQPARVLEDERRELTELCESLFQQKGERQHILDSLYLASYLSDSEVLMDALHSGKLESATHELQRLSFSKSENFDGACLCFFSALRNYATALAYEEHCPNVMWCALLEVARDISRCKSYLEFMSASGQPKGRLTPLASQAQAGALGGEQKSRNYLLLRTKLALLLFQRKPDNAWKDDIDVAKALKEPLQQFIKENKIETLGQDAKLDLEKSIIDWLAVDPEVKKAFRQTRRHHKP